MANSVALTLKNWPFTSGQSVNSSNPLDEEWSCPFVYTQFQFVIFVTFCYNRSDLEPCQFNYSAYSTITDKWWVLWQIHSQSFQNKYLVIHACCHGVCILYIESLQVIFVFSCPAALMLYLSPVYCWLDVVFCCCFFPVGLLVFNGWWVCHTNLPFHKQK